MARDILEPAGYSAILTSDPLEAVRLARDSSRNIDLLLTDVVMPLMDGRVLAQRMLAIRPDIQVVLMSAYDVPGVATTGWPFIAKPFGIEGLEHKIAVTLRERPPIVPGDEGSSYSAFWTESFMSSRLAPSGRRRGLQPGEPTFSERRSTSSPGTIGAARHFTSTTSDQNPRRRLMDPTWVVVSQRPLTRGSMLLLIRRVS